MGVEGSDLSSITGQSTYVYPFQAGDSTDCFVQISLDESFQALLSHPWNVTELLIYLSLAGGCTVV